MTIALRSLQGIEDPLLIPWLDLYETTFPPRRRLLASHIMRLMLPDSLDQRSVNHFLVAETEEKLLAGLAMVQEYSPVPISFLWFMAINPSLRSQGLGSQIYKALIDQFCVKARMLVFEVEIPERQNTPEKTVEAQRRIQFYQRLGAKLLAGIEHVSYIGESQNRHLTYLMFHCLVNYPPEYFFRLSLEVFGERTRQVGTLEWVPFSSNPS